MIEVENAPVEIARLVKQLQMDGFVPSAQEGSGIANRSVELVEGLASSSARRLRRTRDRRARERLGLPPVVEGEAG